MEEADRRELGGKSGSGFAIFLIEIGIAVFRPKPAGESGNDGYDAKNPGPEIGGRYYFEGDRFSHGEKVNIIIALAEDGVFFGERRGGSLGWRWEGEGGGNCVARGL